MAHLQPHECPSGEKILSQPHDHVQPVPPAESDLASVEFEKSPRRNVIVTIIGCGLANLSDGFQQNLATNTNVVFAHLLGSTVYDSTAKTRVSNGLLVGAVIGILILGYTSDKWSRKSGMLFTSGLVVVGTLMVDLAFQVLDAHGAHSMLWYVAIARGIAGVGVGGEYPTSSAAALEGSNEWFDRNRGPILVATGPMMATSAAPILTFIYLMTLLGSNNNLAVAFHCIYSISTLLPLAVMLFRLQMRDGLLFRKSNFKTRRIPWILCVRKYWGRLVGLSAAFFLYDFINFPNSIMSSAIINSLVPSKDIRTVAVWQLILTLFPVPGVVLGSWLVNRIGRRWTGIIGFAGYAILGFIIGGCYDALTDHSIAAFVVLYGLFQCMGHMGPGASIGLMSTESYPTAVRGLGYGISAGFGKAGAAIGTQVFTPLQDAAGNSATFYLAGGLALVGIGIYWFLPELRDTDLGMMDAEFEAYLAAHGYHGGKTRPGDCDGNES